MKNVRAFNITAQGANHIKKNKICQDSSKSYDYDERVFAIVCDGHGGDDYVRSDIGSSEAASIAGSCIGEFIDTVLKKYDIGYLQRHYEEILRVLSSSIISKWRSAVEGHCRSNPFTEEEMAKISDRARIKYSKGNIASAYGTTLIAVAFTEEYWFGIKIGDGKCVALSKDGEYYMPIPDDGICFLNSTTSICDKNAIDNFRYAFSTEKPAAVFVGTDGIDDCFNKDEQLFNLYRTILYSFATSNFDQAVIELSDYLPRLSAKGSGDDVSIAAIIDFDVIGNMSEIRNLANKVDNNVEGKDNVAQEEKKSAVIEEKMRNTASVSDSSSENMLNSSVVSEESGFVDNTNEESLIGFARGVDGEYIKKGSDSIITAPVQINCNSSSSRNLPCILNKDIITPSS